MAPFLKPIRAATALALALSLAAPSIADAADGEGDTALPATESADASAGREKLPEESRRLFAALDAVLQSLALERADLDALPSEKDSLVGSYFNETREEREAKIDELLAQALDIVLEESVKGLQDEIEAKTGEIAALEDRLIALREKRLTVPEDSSLPSLVVPTVKSIDEEIAGAERQIGDLRDAIEAAHGRLREGLERSGVTITPEQFELLRRSVLSADVVQLVAAFNAVKATDEQLAQLLGAAGDNAKAARKYFAMHAALLALLAHAQKSTVENIDRTYLPRLDEVARQTKQARETSKELLAEIDDPERRRVVESNMASQELTLRVADAYRTYLQSQRRHFARALAGTLKDVRIADNTVRTVEASLQMLTLIRETGAAFEALGELEAPGFEEIFRNEELRREFENLTSKLRIPSS